MNLLQIHLGCGSVYHGRASQRGPKARGGKSDRSRSIKETWDPNHVLCLKNLKQQMLALARGPPISLSFGPSRQKVWARPSSDSSQYSCKTFI